MSMERPIEPCAWLVTPLVEDGDEDACAWLRKPGPDDYATWAACGVNVRVSPLYALTIESVAIINEARKAKAWAARDTNCGCEMYHYCDKCFPPEFRKGGMWDL